MWTRWFAAGIPARDCWLDAMPARPPDGDQPERRRLESRQRGGLGLAGFFSQVMHLPRGMDAGPAPEHPPPADDRIGEDINILPFRTVGMGPEPVRKALRLLARVATPEQRAELKMFGQFTVHVPGRGDYTILPRSVFNVVEVDTGIAFCAAPLVPVPIPDLMLLQKLMLENEPDRFFAVANRRRADVAFPPSMRP